MAPMEIEQDIAIVRNAGTSAVVLGVVAFLATGLVCAALLSGPEIPMAVAIRTPVLALTAIAVFILLGRWIRNGPTRTTGVALASLATLTGGWIALSLTATPFGWILLAIALVHAVKGYHAFRRLSRIPEYFETLPPARPAAAFASPVLALFALALLGAFFLGFDPKGARVRPGDRVWKEFCPPAGLWTATFPGEPKSQVIDMAIAGTAHRLPKQRFSVAEERGAIFTVEVVDYAPLGGDFGARARAILEAERDNMLRAIPGSQLLDCNFDDFGPHPACDVSIFRPQRRPLSVRIKMVLAGSVFYHIRAISEDEGDDGDRHRFVNSFALAR